MATRPLHVVYATLALVCAGASVFAATPLPVREDRSVYDLAELIEPAQESSMEALHRQLLERAGIAIVVITVLRLEEEVIDDFAVRVGEEWGVGKKGEDLGLVVALSAEDRRVFVATGYGLEGFLPDGRVGRMIDSHAMPLFRENRLGEGLYLLSAGLAKASADEFGVELADVPSLPAEQAPKLEIGLREVVAGLFFLGLFGYLAWRHPGLLLFLLFFSSRRSGGWGGGGFGGASGFGGFGGGGFGGGGAGRGF